MENYGVLIVFKDRWQNILIVIIYYDNFSNQIEMESHKIKVLSEKKFISQKLTVPNYSFVME